MARKNEITRTNYDKLPAKERKLLLQLAQKVVMAMETREDLAYHMSDGEDFFEVSVGDLADAIATAYTLGKQAGKEVRA